MHAFKHGELKSGRRGKGGRVKSRRQAIAIALKEAGASRSETKTGHRRRPAKRKREEAHGQTAQQRKGRKSHVGASGRKTGTGSSKRTTPPPLCGCIAQDCKPSHIRSEEAIVTLPLIMG